MTLSTPRTDIRDRDDIARLVTEFYIRAFADPVLGPIFTDIAGMDLAAHMPVMCDFWETVLFRTGLYRGNAFTVHLQLHQKKPLTPVLFQRWLGIWQGTVDDLYAGRYAELAKIQARRIAGGSSQRLERTGEGELLVISAQETR